MNTPRKQWKAAYRFTRSMKGLYSEQRSNGLYPSWLPDKEYREFLAWCRVANEVRCPFVDKLEERLPHAKCVKEIERRLDWCEQTTMEDVKRHIRDELKDLYHFW